MVRFKKAFEMIMVVHLPQGPASVKLSELVNLFTTLLMFSNFSLGSTSFLTDSLQIK